jgi:XRE family transcriptional regulator, regulator of sulfur utilization
MAPSDKPQPALGKAIRQLREKKGLTQEAVAHDAGITTATLGVIERGLSNPTWATLKGIAAALGVSMVEMARQTEKQEP